MTRGDGFDVMDMSTAIFDDPKMKRLARLHPAQYTCAFMAYVATVAASWRNGARVPADDAWPSLLPFEPEALVALRDVGLIDAHLCVARRTWTAWYQPAFDRREARRAAGRSGGRAKAERSSGDALPVRPTVRPSDKPSLAGARARQSRRAPSGPTNLGEALSGTPLGEAIAAKSRERT